MKKGWKIALAIVCAVLLVVGIIGGVVYGMLKQVYSDTVSIVEKFVTDTVPQVDNTLQAVEGVPDDIGEDYDVEITDVDLEQKPIFEQAVIDENVINILIVGQDTGLEWNESTRSDSCMIISYNRSEKSVKVVSVMRDIWTPIEGHGWNRINAAYSFGGIGLLINTINEVYGLDIQNYVITGFDEFKTIIDKLGGLDMELTEKEAEYLNKREGINVKPGMNHLTGEMALIHARNRRTGDGDFGRVRRQRDIVLSIFNKLKSEGNVASYISFMEFGLSNIKTNMEPAEILTLGLEVLQADHLDIAYSRIPFDGTWSYATKDGKSVLSINSDKNKKLLNEFLYGAEEDKAE